ncbi:GIY-YIG nuclease family protein [Arenibacter lacus]|uniref:GIY-YIG nuclease family protein n=1 Tax=Arenibacter lacus TaxID=2608629 RepID=UPI00123DB1EC|nr:GIY-YIG nuclease family protein [Arenibacter lacus]
MVWVYAISSLTSNYIYVGMTTELEARIRRHNGGREKTTKPYIPFKLIFTECCENRLEGRKREKYWKSGVGKEQLRSLRDKNN